jgi:hypothetical protein
MSVRNSARIATRLFLCASLAIQVLLFAGRPGVGGERPGVSEAAIKPGPAEVAAWRKRLVELGKLFDAGEGSRRENVERGREEVAAIADPAAVPAIVKHLEKEKNGLYRRALIQPLISIGGKDAIACLVKWSVEDQNPYVRQEACHGLAAKEELPQFLDAYLAYLAPVPQGRNMRFPTEAAEALSMTGLAARLKEGDPPNENLVRALVRALDSARVDVVQTNAALIKNAIPDPRDSEARQKRKTPFAGRVYVPETPNPVVLATLQEYTGEDFQYDKKAWLDWLEKMLKE